jgi:hypothetical protein
MNLVNFLQEAIVTDRQIQNQYASMYRTFNAIECAIQEAWKIWDEDVLTTYYKGEKPEEPTESFSLQWIENEDFEADGHDVDEMCKEFGVDKY